jgi:hypothetical protein
MLLNYSANIYIKNTKRHCVLVVLEITCIGTHKFINLIYTASFYLTTSELLLENGADSYLKENHGYTPLHEGLLSFFIL